MGIETVYWKGSVTNTVIEVDISNIWGVLSLSDLLGIEADISAAHHKVVTGSGEGGEFVGWLDLPKNEAGSELVRIQKAAGRIR